LHLDTNRDHSNSSLYLPQSFNLQTPKLNCWSLDKMHDLLKAQTSLN